MNKLYERLCEIEAFVARITLWGMVILIFTAGIARLLKTPINWAVDMSTCLFAWSCFLSADIAWREDKLMSVDILVRVLPERARQVLKFVNYAILLLFLLYLLVFGFELAYTTRARAFQGIPAFSYSWVTLSVPVGAIFLFVTTLRKIRRDLKRETKAEQADGMAGSGSGRAGGAG